MSVPTASLVVDIDGERTFPLDADGTCTIGRSPKNTIQLNGDAVSRNHALVRCNDKRTRFCIYDLSSRNGTLLNGGRLVVPTILENGDVISIGNFQLTFQDSSSGDDQSRTSRGSETIFRLDISEVTVLVTDIRDYTGLAQRVDETRLATMMGAFNREAGVALQSKGVWTTKYIGDAIMAVWQHGARDQSLDVLVGALESLSEIEDIAASLHSRFGLADPVRIGAGISNGMASIGNLGGGAAADHTALGDAVNQAFRLESATKELRTDIAFNFSVKNTLPASVDLSEITEEHRVSLKGYKEPMVVYTLRANALAVLLPELRRHCNPAKT